MGRLVFTYWILATASSLAGQDPARWPQFRGPGGLALAPTEVEVPVPFHPTKDRLWRITTPKGHSSPVVWGDRIFLTGYRDDRLLMSCYSRRTGKLQWEHSVKAQGKEERLNESGCPAMPSACTDGERVFFYFGAYGLQARKVTGELLWEKRLPVPRSEFGTGNSPVIVGDTVILIRDGTADSAVLALACKDGAVRWKLPRFAFVVSYTTPFLWRNRHREELVLAGSGRLVSLEPKTGRRLWQLKDGPVMACPTPTADRDRLYFVGWNPPASSGAPMLESLFGIGKVTRAQAADSASLFRAFDKDKDGGIAPAELPNWRARDWFDQIDTDHDGRWQQPELEAVLQHTGLKGRNVCFAVPAGGKGDLAETNLAWTFTRGLPYVPSPLLYRSRLYLVKSGGLVTCLDPKTGKPHFKQKRLGDTSEWFASPIGVGGHVLVVSGAGTVSFLKAADAFHVAGSIDLGEAVHATPAVLTDQILLRTAGHLLAIGRRPR